ncbi:MFS transporter [Ruminococcaceae bacterium OttesenSCG-928-L11]|nr:MFS transporter [Ruminococcaceae bacterium OttesenSCG-928-L11]
MQLNRKTKWFLAVNAMWSLAANFAHPITPTVIKDLGLGDYMFGVALSCMMTANFLFSPFWGKINGYISSRVSLLICNLGYALGQFLFMMARTELHVGIARFVAGIFCGGCMVSMLTYIVNTSTEDNRGQALTVQATLQAVCSAFGFMIGGLLGEISVNTAFMAQVVALSTAGVLFFLVGENDATQERGALSGKVFFKEVNPFSAFLSSRKFMTVLLAVLFAITALQNLGFTSYEQGVNYYIKDQFGFSSAYNGLLKGAIGITSLIANSTLCLWLLRRTDTRRSLAVLYAVCTAALLSGLWLHSFGLFAVGNLLYFASNAVSLPLLQGLIADRAQGEHRNLVMGFYNAMKSLGGIIGPLTVGFLYLAWPRVIFVFAGCAYLLGTVCAVVYYRMMKKREKAGQL